MADAPSIAVLAELDRGDFRPTTWEGLALARQIQARFGGSLKLLALGDPVEEPAERLAEEAGEEVLAFQTAGLPGYHPEVYLQVLADYFRERQPSYLLIPQTSRAWELAPRLALRLQLSCITGVTRIVSEADRPAFLRPLYGGKINARVEAATDGLVLTFEPGYFKEEVLHSAGSGSWTIKRVGPFSPPSEMLETVPAPETGTDLRGADTVVAAGRGIGKLENLEMIRHLAGRFPRSAVAGSRPLCDLGWLKYNQQVGLTGATVSPKLYVACGISGAYQHVAGMKDSGFIVSINRDPRAAISNWADLCIVEDLETFIPLLIETLQTIKKDKKE